MEQPDASSRFSQAWLLFLAILVNCALFLGIGALGWRVYRRQDAALDRLAEISDRVDRHLVDLTSRVTAADRPSDGSLRHEPAQVERVIEVADQHFRDQNYDAAIQGYLQALALVQDPDRQARLHFHLGESYFATARYAEAIEHYQQVCWRGFDQAYASISQFQIGQALFEQRDYGAARRAFFRLIARQAALPQSERDLLGRACYRVADACLAQAGGPAQGGAR